MIFPELRVPIPDIGGFTISRGNVKYCYVYVGDRVPSGKDGKTMHPKSRCIGGYKESSTSMMCVSSHLLCICRLLIDLPINL